MAVGKAHAHGRSIDLRTLPRNGKENRRVTERAEVIRVVGVLPQVIGVHDEKLPKSLLKAGIELVALTGANRRLQARATDDVDDDRVARSQACENQVLVERGLQNTRVGGAENRIGLLDVVCKTHARLRLPIVDDPAIQITT